ncbi:hypothetical protein [Nocardia brasiliensis]
MTVAPDGEDLATAPGAAVLAGTVLGVAILLCVRLGRVPFAGALTDPDQLVGIVLGGVLLGVCLLIWAIKTLYVVGRQRQWSWRIVAVPVVVFAGAAAGLVA